MDPSLAASRPVRMRGGQQCLFVDDAIFHQDAAETTTACHAVAGGGNQSSQAPRERHRLAFPTDQTHNAIYSLSYTTGESIEHYQ
jgi:hypothetical protein